MTLLLSNNFVFCPYCGKALPIEPGPRQGQHIQCSRCDRCFTCEEKAVRGWRKDHPSPIPTTPATTKT